MVMGGVWGWSGGCGVRDPRVEKEARKLGG